MMLSNIDYFCTSDSYEAYLPKCVEEEFSEVRGSKLPIMHSLKLSTTAWRYLFGVETRRLRSIRCTIVYQEVTTRNRTTTREFLAPKDRGYGLSHESPLLVSMILKESSEANLPTL